jgi:5S rRNA maturation endonuclease (ribonuclease M5)
MIVADRLKGRKTLQVANFLDEFEKDDIKKDIDIVRLFQHFGVNLTKKGKSYLGKCPWHDDRNPSLSVDREKGLYNCFGCGESGDIFTLTEKMKGLSFRESVTYLKDFAGKDGVQDENITPLKLAASSAMRKNINEQKNEIALESGESKANENMALDAEPGNAPDENVTLATIAGYYHKKLYEEPEAVEYLKKRGLSSLENYGRFQIGFADGSLLEVIGESRRKTLKELGVLREKGSEHFRNCIIFPIIDELGQVVGMYGRSIDDTARTKHLYLKGKHRGVFNRKASKVFDEIILAESIIDCLSLIELGIENVQSIYGAGGFTDEHLQILKDDRVKTIVLAFDADNAGKTASEKLSERLLSEGFSVKSIAPPVVPNLFPDHPQSAPKDWNEYLCAGGDVERIREAITKAEARKAESLSSGEGSSSGMAVEKTPLGYDFTFTSTPVSIASGVIYRLTNVKEMFVGNLKVNMRAELVDHPDAEKFYDHVDLYSSRSRAACSANISRIFAIEPRLIEKDIIRILEYLEAERDRRLAVGNRDKGHDMTAEETALGMELLTDKKIFDRFLNAMETLGYVGDTVNKLLMFIAACSRKMDDPISVMVISQSSGGKTKLVETVESLIPPEDVISVTSLSDQALNYVSDMEHKFLVLGEAVHGIEVEHQLREIQSSHKLTRGVTVKDEKTGRMETQFVATKAVCSCALTSTGGNINPENASRNFIIEVDESAEQTAKVHEMQKGKYSFERHELKINTIPKIIAAFHAAGRLLSKIFIVNNFARHMRFPANVMRTRRDFERFLDLVAAVCFVRQFQKKRHVRNNIEYIKCDLNDYGIAHGIIMKTLASTLFELSTGTVDFYEKLREMTRKLGVKKGLKANEVSVTQRDIREYTGYSLQWVKKQLRILIDYEYVIVVKGGGSRVKGFYRIREDEPISKIDLSMIPTPEKMAELIKNDKDNDEVEQKK